MKGESIEALRQIKIKDSREILVDLKKFCSGIIIDLEPRRLKKEKTIYVRKTVAKMLKQAEKFLPPGHRFKIFDGWRPLKKQKYYYKKVYRKIEKKHPDWSKAQLRRATNKWVFPPDVGIPPYHTTGGAIDLTICYSSGREWPMRSKKDRPPKRVLKNRQFLRKIMEKVGLTNYPLEWWHFSYGDSGWALRTGRKKAIYGEVKRSQIR